MENRDEFGRRPLGLAWALAFLVTISAGGLLILVGVLALLEMTL